MKITNYIDLHVHTNYSDGSFSPKQVIDYCKNIGVVAVGITDHDTTLAIEEAIEEGRKENLEVISGVELSCNFKNSSEGEIHILGYFIDWKNESLQKKLKIFREARKERALKILKKLNSLGFHIKEEEIINNNINSIGRLHFARLLVEKNITNSIKEAFDLYLGYGKPAYVEKFKLEVKEAISLILESKGIPILAHPYWGTSLDVESLKKLINLGIKGIEVYHPKHSKNVINELLTLAEKYELLVTGGSDCHGVINGQKPLLGSLKLSYEILKKLKDYNNNLLK